MGFTDVPSDAPERLGASHGNNNINSVDPYDDHSAELMDLLAILYFVIEVCRTDETFGDELSECKFYNSSPKVFPMSPNIQLKS